MSGGWSRYTRGRSSYEEMNAGCNTLLVAAVILLVGLMALGQVLGSFDASNRHLESPEHTAAERDGSGR